MPGGDRRGPFGEGPMTGRAAGYCSGNDVPGVADPDEGRFGRGPGWGNGRRGGRGRGFGFGWRNRFFRFGGAGKGRSATAPGMEPASLQQDLPAEDFGDSEVGLLQRQADALRKRLARLEERLRRRKEPQDK